MPVDLDIITCPEQLALLIPKTRQEIVAKYNQSAKRKAAVERWRIRNPRKSREDHYKHRYGLSMDEYNAMVARCGNLCECCGKPETTRDHRTGKIRSLSVDHSHLTGQIRGLTCRRCNWAIGLVEDEPQLADFIARYLYTR